MFSVVLAIRPALVAEYQSHGTVPSGSTCEAAGTAKGSSSFGKQAAAQLGLHLFQASVSRRRPANRQLHSTRSSHKSFNFDCLTGAYLPDKLSKIQNTFLINWSITIFLEGGGKLCCFEGGSQFSAISRAQSTAVGTPPSGLETIYN